MKFKRLINKSKETRRKYEYYLSLGYSEHAAKVLSVVTYGDEKLVFLIKQLGRKNVMEELYAWLHERKEGTPEEAIEAFYEEKHPRPKYEEERGLGCWPLPLPGWPVVRMMMLMNSWKRYPRILTNPLKKRMRRTCLRRRRPHSG